MRKLEIKLYSIDELDKEVQDKVFRRIFGYPNDWNTAPDIMEEARDLGIYIISLDPIKKSARIAFKESVEYTVDRLISKNTMTDSCAKFLETKDEDLFEEKLKEYLLEYAREYADLLYAETEWEEYKSEKGEVFMSNGEVLTIE